MGVRDREKLRQQESAVMYNNKRLLVDDDEVQKKSAELQKQKASQSAASVQKSVPSLNIQRRTPENTVKPLAERMDYTYYKMTGNVLPQTKTAAELQDEVNSFVRNSNSNAMVAQKYYSNPSAYNEKTMYGIQQFYNSKAYSDFRYRQLRANLIKSSKENGTTWTQRALKAIEESQKLQNGIDEYIRLGERAYYAEQYNKNQKKGLTQEEIDAGAKELAENPVTPMERGMHFAHKSLKDSFSLIGNLVGKDDPNSISKRFSERLNNTQPDASRRIELENAVHADVMRYRLDQFENVKNNADFAEKSKGIDESKYKIQRMFDDDGLIPVVDKFGKNVEKTLQDNYISEEEQQIYNYIYNTKGYKEAEEYYDLLALKLNERMTTDYLGQVEEMTLDAPVPLNVASFATNAMSGLGYVNDTVNTLSGKPLDTNNLYHLPANVTNEIRTTTQDNYIDSDVGKFLYSTGMSIGDFAVAAAISKVASVPQIATTLLGTSAATNTVIDAKNRGLSDAQAYTLGTTAGAIEYVTEKIPLDNLFDAVVNKKVTAQMITKQIVTEGTEELVSSSVNLVTDVIVSKDKSEWEVLIAEYMKQGMSREKAIEEAVKHEAGKLALDFAGGAISGGVMGGGVSAYNNTVNNQYNKIVGNQLTENNQNQNVFELAKGLDYNSEANKYAYSANPKKSKQLGKLYDKAYFQADTEVNNNSNQIIAQRLADLGEKASTIPEISEGIRKTVYNEPLSEHERNMLGASKNARQVLKEFEDALSGRESAIRHESIDRRNKLSAALTTKSIDNTVTVGSKKEKTKVTGVKSISENGVVTYNLENGKTATSKEVSFDNEFTAQLNESASKYGAVGADAFIKMYGGEDAVEYSQAFDALFRQGKNDPDGKLKADVMDTPAAQFLNPSQSEAAYEAGRVYAQKLSAEPQQEINSKPSYVTDIENIAQKGSQKTIGNVNITGIRTKNLTKKQKASINVMNEVSKVTNGTLKMVAFESTADLDGQIRESNGWYDSSTNTIYFDINAGIDNVYRQGELDRAILRTGGHELTHFIQHMSPDYYDSLAGFIVDTVNSADPNGFESLVAAKMKALPKLSYDEVYDEVIADSCEMLLRDSKAIQKLARENMTLAQKIKAWIDDFVKNIRKAFEGVSAKSQEAVILEQILGDMTELQNMWDEALEDALRTSKDKGTANGTQENSNIKHSIRYTTDNKPVVVIEENILDGVPENEWIKTVKTVMSENFSAGIPIKGRLVKVNRITKREYVNSKNTQYYHKNKKVIYQDKMKAASQLDEIVVASTNYINEDLSHTRRKDNFKEFARGEVLMSVFENDYNAQVIIAINGNNEMVLYDIVSFKPASFTIKKEAKSQNTVAPQKRVNDRADLTSEDSVPPSSEKVNKIQKSDRAYLDAVESGDMETVQKMVEETARSKGYDSPVLYHGTHSFGFTSFDLDKMDDKRSIFLTNSKAIASTYSGVTGSKKIGKVNTINISDMSAEEIVNKLNEYDAEFKKGTTEGPHNYELYDFKKTNSLINKVNDGIEKLKGIVAEKIRNYADRMSLDFDEKDAKNHRQLVALAERLDRYDYENLSTPIYLLLHHTDVFNGSAEIAELEKNIRLMNQVRRKDLSSGVIVDEALGGYDIEVMEIDRARDYLENRLKSGNYSLYAKLGKSLVIDGKGALWKDIRNWSQSLAVNPSDVSVVKKGDFYELVDNETQEVIENASYGINTFTQELYNTNKAKLRALMINNANSILRINTEALNTTRDIAKFAKEHGYDSVVFKEIVDNGGWNSEVDYNEIADIYVIFDENSVKSADAVTYDDNGDIIPLSERFNVSQADIRYSRRDYSYDALISKPDMKITVVDDTTQYKPSKETRNYIVNEAIKNAASVGYTNENGNAVVHVKDIDTDVLISKRSVMHGLDRRLEISAPVILNIGNIIENSIQINELLPRESSAKSSYVLVGVAEGTDDELYIVRSVVNQYANEVTSIDVLYAVNAKKESAGKSPEVTDKSALPTDSVISISDLLNYVNKHFPDILPEGVLKHYGHTERPAGSLSDSVLFSRRSTQTDGRYLAKELKREYISSLDVNGMQMVIDSLAEYQKRINTSDDYEAFYQTARQFAEKILANSNMLDETNAEKVQELERLKKYFGGKTFKMTKALHSEIVNFYGDYQTFRNAMFGRRIYFSKSAEYSLDSYWGEICETFPELFDEDTNPGDQPMALMSAFESFYVEKGIDEKSDYYAETLDTLTDKIIDNLPQQSDDGGEVDTENFTHRELLRRAISTVARNDTERDFLSRYQREIKDVEKKHEEVAKLRREIHDVSFTKGSDRSQLQALQNRVKILEDRIQRSDKKLLQLEATKALKDVVEREKKTAVKKANEKNKQTFEKYKSRKRSSETREKIKKLQKEMVKSLLYPTDKNYIPPYLVKSMVDVCNAIDFSTDRTAPDGGKTKVQEQREKIIASLNKLKNQYENLKKDTDPNYRSEYDESMSDELAQLVEMVSNSRVGDMTETQLQAVYQSLKTIQGTLRDAKKQIGMEEGRSNAEIGLGIIEEQRQIDRKKKGVKKLGQKYSDLVAWNTVSPMRNILRISGYDKNSELYQLAEQLNEGQRKKDIFVMESHKMFEPLIEGKENKKKYQDAIGKAHDFGVVDVDGNAVEMSKMTAMQLVMSWEREMASDGKHSHLQQSGAIIPNHKLLMDGKVSEAVSAEHAQRIDIDATLINDIVDQLDEWDKEYMEVAHKFFDEKSKNALNETSRVVSHRDVALSEKYIPYKVDEDFVFKKEISDENHIRPTLISMGMLKDTVRNAGQPLVMTSLNHVLDTQIEQVGAYYGLAIPVRNFNKVWNFMSDNRISVRESITKNWGKKGMSVIDRTIRDLQADRVVERNRFIDTANSAFVRSVLNSNISVTLKQLSALPSAYSVLNQRFMPGYVYGQFLKMCVPSKYNQTIKEIDEYTAAHWLRRQGLSIQELGDIAKSMGRMKRFTDKIPAAINPTKWIQGMDCLVTASFWDMCKKDIRKQGEFKEGTEEFNRAVADLYNRVIEDTQAVYDTLHRPEVIKTTNALTRQLFMFRSESLQHSGILYEKYGAFLENKDAESRKEFFKTAYAQFSSAFSFAALSLVAAGLLHKMNPYRDEDEELTPESIIAELLNDLTNVLADLVMPIGGAQLQEFIYGKISGNKYSDGSLSVPAVDFINDFIDSVSTLNNAITAEEPDDGKIIKAVEDLTFKFAGLFGIPADNAKNIIKMFILHVDDAVNGEFGSFEAGVDRSNTVNYHRATEALIEGDMQKYDDVITEFTENEVGQDKIQQGIKNQLKEFYLDGQINDQQAIKLLAKYGGDEDENDAYFTVKKWNDTDNSWSVYDDLEEAVTTGKDIDSTVNELIDHGYDEDTVYSKVKSITKTAYVNGEISESEARAIISKYLDKDDSEIYWVFDEWNYYKENSTAESGDYQKYGDLFTVIDQGGSADIAGTVKVYMDNGVSKKSISSTLTKQYKDKYIELYYSDKTAAANLKNSLLRAYYAAGYNWDNKSKDIDAWLKDS